jgi:hypothetical protein
MFDSLFRTVSQRIALTLDPAGLSPLGVALREGVVRSGILGNAEPAACDDCYGLPDCGGSLDVCDPLDTYCPGCWYSDCGYDCCDYVCLCLGECVSRGGGGVSLKDEDVSPMA